MGNGLETQVGNSLPWLTQHRSFGQRTFPHGIAGCLEFNFQRRHQYQSNVAVWIGPRGEWTQSVGGCCHIRGTDHGMHGQ